MITNGNEVMNENEKEKLQNTSSSLFTPNILNILVNCSISNLDNENKGFPMIISAKQHPN